MCRPRLDSCWILHGGRIGTAQVPFESLRAMNYRPQPMQKREFPRTFRVKSFGCQMNVYDGERMAELLAADGMAAAADGAAADLVVLNTCHIREKATEKVYSEIGRLKRPDGSRPISE